MAGGFFRVLLLSMATVALAGAFLPAQAASEWPPDAWVEPVEGVSLTPRQAGESPTALAVAPDGAVWFVGSRSTGPPTVGRMASNGELTEASLPEPAFALGIAVDPDGVAWVTGGTTIGRDREGAEKIEGRLYRITATGDISEFPAPDPRTGGSIAIGPDRNIWVADILGSQVVRFAPSGAPTAFPLPQGRKPAWITAGPDGNLWFTEPEANRIGRITPFGTITEFRLPKPNGRPNEIVSGPDGNLWFTFVGANRIGRITPLGVVEQFPVPTESGTASIVTGPDGNLWFSSRDRLGSITPLGRPVRRTCPNRRCHLPIISLAATAERIWLGTSRSMLGYGGGFSEMTRDQTEPGFLGWLTPRAPRTALGRVATRVAGRQTTLRVTCLDPDGCRGSLKLLSRGPGHFGPYASPRISTLAGRGYELAPGESRRIALRLTSTAMSLLTKKGRLPTWATSGSRPDVEAIRQVVLRPRMQR